MTKEIVIAAYDRDISWINEIDDNIIKTIYRKGNVNKYKNEIRLKPNVGRCVHTFFNHLYMRYDSLSDYTFFAQDFPFDHWENIVDIINGDINLLDKHATLIIGEYYAFHYNTIDYGGGRGFGGGMWRMYPSKQFKSGKVLTCEFDGYPQDERSLFNIDDFWEEIFDCQHPREYEFVPGGHFVISKNQVLLRSKKFYEKICNILIKYEEAPWVIERLEAYIFDIRYKTKI